MKTFKKTYLPEFIDYNGYRYTKNTDATDAFQESPWCSLEKWDGLKPILVEVLARELRGKRNLHGKEYQPTRWVFTLSEDQVRWKVVEIYRDSDRRNVIARNLSREAAKSLCLSIPATKKKSAHIYRM